MAGAEQRRGGVEVVGGQAEGLLRHLDTVAEMDSLLPDRIPDGVGDRGDIRPRVVKEHDVDVAAGGQL
jgi:hypothetical protein